MADTGFSGKSGGQHTSAAVAIELRRQESLLKTGALQDAIFNSVNFSSIATNASGVIQIFNVGAERMLGYAAADILDKCTPADISDGQELIARAASLCMEFETSIAPGFEALVFKAARGIEDIYELTYIRQDGSRLPAVVSVTALRDDQDGIIGYLLIATDNTARKLAEKILQESEGNFRFMNDLTEATRMLDDPVQVMAAMSRKLGIRLHASRCAYADVLSDGERFSILHDYTDGCASTVGNYQLSHFGSKAVSRLSHGQTLIIRDVDLELLPDDGAGMFNAIGIKATIVCPLVKNGSLRAMMAVHQTSPRDWAPGEVALVQEIVERCWATLERNTAQKKLRESEALLHLAGRIAQLGGWTVDLLDARTTLSNQACMILDMAPGSPFQLEQLFSSCSPQSQEIVRKAFNLCARQGNPFDLVLEMVTSNGRRIWARCTGEAQHIEGDVITHVHGALQDITERRRLVERQLDEAARQMAILNSLPAHIALLDREGFIISVNDEWRQFAEANLLGYPDHGVGMNYLDTCAEALGEGTWGAGESEEGIRAVLNGEAKAFSIEYPCHSPTEERWFQMTVTPLTPNKMSGVIVMHVNVTVRRQAQNEISRLNTELEERVRLRTGQLQVANQELEAFSYSASHDLRTPLSAIDGYSSLLVKELAATTASERSKHYLARIRAGVTQMGELIDALLSLAQLSRTSLRRDPMDLSAMARAILLGLQERDPERQASFDVQPELAAKGDTHLLQRVLENLLGNAWKFSARQPQIRIAFIRETDAAGEDVYIVRDNGAGFDMAYADKLFGAFQRLHTTTEFAGTGIGLATVHRIITRHGGRIWAESVPGEGASFHFTLGKPQD